MSFARTIVLGAIAGSTIFLGLPMGRMRKPRPRLKALLNAFSAGILVFLLFDILENATEPLERLMELTAAGRADPARHMINARESVDFIVSSSVGSAVLTTAGRYPVMRIRRGEAVKVQVHENATRSPPITMARVQNRRHVPAECQPSGVGRA